MRLAFLAFLVLLSASFSWDWDTHQWFAARICDYYGCGCMEEIRNGSIAPDRDFRDTANHHLYDPSTCKNSSYYSCPAEYDDIAIQKMREYLDKVPNIGPIDCQDWYNIGVASHYYLDSKVIWHQVKGEDYDKCHEPFETKVGEYFKKGVVDFSVTKCGETVYGSDFSGYMDEFIGILGYERRESGIGLGQIAAFAISIAIIIALAALGHRMKKK